MDINKLCIHCMNETDVNAGGTCPHCGQIVGEQPELTHQLKPLTILRGKYLVGDVLGEGGFGITYIGIDLNLELKVAIKEFYPNGFATRESASTSTLTIYSGQQMQTVYKWRDNFMKEARSLAKCAYLPGVVGVRDFFEENNTAYLVMEYVEGMTLKSYAKSKNGRIPVSELLPAIEPIFTALGEIHKQGLIHRDISPDNIMLLSGGDMKLLDFGAARDYSGDNEKSLSVMLKPGYAPEEQYRTKGKQGPWSDIYALAGTIYKCLTGITPPEALERMRDDELQRPNAHGAQLSAGQEEALLKAMAVHAEDRYQTMGEFRKDFYTDMPGSQSAQTVQSTQHTQTLSQTEEGALSGNFQKKQQAYRIGLLCAGIVAVLFIVIFGIIKLRGNQESSAAETVAEESIEDNSYDSEPEAAKDMQDDEDAAENSEPVDNEPSDMVEMDKVDESEYLESSDTAVVTPETAWIRASASTNSETIGRVMNGDKLEVIAQQIGSDGRTWIKVKYDEMTGYIRSDLVEIDTIDESTHSESSDTAATTVTVKENANVRTSANESSEKLGTVYIGDKLDLIKQQDDGWTKIMYNGMTAYVKSKCVEVDTIDSGKNEKGVSVAIGDYYGIQGFTFQYAGYDLTRSYPSDTDNTLFSINASDGSQLLVLRFMAANVSSTDQTLDMSGYGAGFRVSVNGGAGQSILTTMLLDDMQTYNGVVSAGDVVELVSIVEIPQSVSVKTIDFILRGNGEDTVITLQ